MFIIISLLVGIIFLVVGSKIFIAGASDIGNRYHISSLVIGLTIVAFGSSMPELIVSLKAMASGYTDIVIFNMMGSNIINILLIFGLVSFIKPLKITNFTVKKELPLMMLATFLFGIVSLDDLFMPSKNNLITRSDALVLLLFFGLYLYYMYTVIKSRNDIKIYESPKNSLGYSIFITGLGLGMIILGSIFTVDMAYKLSSLVPLKFLSLSVIALATSIPEIIACAKFLKIDNENLIIGDIIGSNIFNICITIGLPVIIGGTLMANSITIIDIINFVLAAFILMLFAPIKHKLGKFEGAIMLIIFMIYYGFIIWEGLGL